MSKPQHPPQKMTIPPPAPTANDGKNLVCRMESGIYKKGDVARFRVTRAFHELLEGLAKLTDSEQQREEVPRNGFNYSREVVSRTICYETAYRMIDRELTEIRREIEMLRLDADLDPPELIARFRSQEPESPAEKQAKVIRPKPDSWKPKPKEPLAEEPTEEKPSKVMAG